jgi:hypothetical protein
LKSEFPLLSLEDQRHLPGVVGRAGLEEAQRRGVGVAARVDGQLEVIARVVAGGLGAKLRAGPCSKP